MCAAPHGSFPKFITTAELAVPAGEKRSAREEYFKPDDALWSDRAVLQSTKEQNLNKRFFTCFLASEQLVAGLGKHHHNNTLLYASDLSCSWAFVESRYPYINQDMIFELKKKKKSIGEKGGEEVEGSSD